jgi:flagella synthesis protein FlgN
MNNDTHLSFDALTTEGINILKNVDDILKSELSALTQRDIDQIKKCAASKAALLSDFSDNTLHRTTLLEKNNFHSTPESIQDFFNACADQNVQTQLKDNWNALEKTLLLVIDANAVNEQVLKRNQKNLDSILSILQGQQANNILYNAKGSKGDYAGQSRIGKA